MTPVYLVSILCGERSFEKEYLQKTCHFSGVEYINISINLEKVEQIIGSPQRENNSPAYLFYLTFYIDYRFTDLFRRGFINASGGKGYFEIDNLEQINVDAISILEFFEKIQSIFDAKFEVSVFLGNTSVKVSSMSEGQRQLIKILGMLGICKKEDCLVLMDEPDAHMNPAWKYEIKETIDQSLLEATNTQAIIATHDPLVINGVSKEFIRIFTYNQSLISNNGFYFTKVIMPDEDTEGLGIDGLLQSEYYRLKTSYDKKTSDKFIRRQELYSKLINGNIEEEEKEELRTLTKEIGLLPVSYNSIDFLYDDFIKVFKNSELFYKEYLSYDEILHRRERIKEIIKALYEGQI